MNARSRGPKRKLALCPRCGMDSGTRMVSSTVPEMFFVACETCGYITKPFRDMAHATRQWNREGKRE